MIINRSAEEVTEAFIDDSGLKAILIREVLGVEGVRHTKESKIDVFISEKDCGSFGFKYEAKVTIKTPISMELKNE